MEINAVIFGVGKMGKLIARYMWEKNVNLVGAVGREKHVGEDLGKVIGLDIPLNVRVTDNPAEVFERQRVDVAVLSLYSFMDEIFPFYEICIKNGVNAISTSEEAFYPWRTSPVLASRLDRMAREHGVTVTAGGFQDIFLTNMIILLSGGCHKIESIAGDQSFNINDYGPEVAVGHAVGLSKAEVLRELNEKGPKPSFLRMNLEAICAGLGLTVGKLVQKTEPVVDEKEDIQAVPLGKTIKRGDVIGLVDIIEIETEQGIRLLGKCTGKVYREGEKDINRWIISGVPEVRVENDAVATDILTCTSIVNRIPDVINAEPGFITVEKMPLMKFLPFPMPMYLK